LIRPMSASRLFAACALLAALGCAGATAGSGSPPIQTDRTVYTVRDSAGLASLTIRMTYRNSTGKDVYLPTCRGPQPPRLQKQVGAEDDGPTGCGVRAEADAHARTGAPLPAGE